MDGTKHSWGGSWVSQGKGRRGRWQILEGGGVGSTPTSPRTTPGNTGKGGKPGKHCLRPHAGTCTRNYACEESPASGHTREPMCPALAPGPNSSETPLGHRDSQAKVPKPGAGRMGRMSSLPRLGFREVFKPTGTVSNGSGTRGPGDETQPPSRTALTPEVAEPGLPCSCSGEGDGTLWLSPPEQDGLDCKLGV